MCEACCEEYWMFMLRGVAGKKQFERYGEACRGREVRPVWELAWNSILHCLLCCCPGFTVEKMKLYLKKSEAGCRDYRCNILNGESLVKGYDYRFMYIYDGYGFMFYLSVIAMYICKAIYDLVWLGQIAILDMIKLYVVWCCDLPILYDFCDLGGRYIDSNI